MVERLAPAAAPAAVALFVAMGIVSSPRPLVVSVLAGLLAVGATLVLTIRATTGWPLVAGAAVSGVAITVIGSGAPSNLGWFGLCVLAALCAFRGGTPQVAWFAAGAVLVLAAQWAAMSDDPGWGAWIAGTLFTTIASLQGRRQRELLEQLRAAQAGLAERARSEERTRIARDMHDVVGHALTVSLLHLTSARLALDEAPEEARASLAEAERLSRRSLAEVRQALGVLRADEPSTFAPTPDADRIEDLVDSFRRAGTPVSCEVAGDLSMLSATGGLTLYRILQEALTNVVRHAPGAAAHVRIEVDANGTRLTVENPGPAAGHRGEPVGTGILGMRERAEALGGRLTAGPSPVGWRVEALLPAAVARIPAETS
jgi:signal transduction histidine kinase